MKKGLYILFGLLLVSSYGCDSGKNPIGSGKSQSVDIPVNPFKRISVKTGNANVYLQQGDHEALKIEAEESLINLFNASVNNETLNIEQKMDTDVNPTKSINFYITSREIDSISLFGSGNLHSQGNLHGDRLRVNISGSGDAELDLTVNDLVLKILGSGDVTIKGKAESQKISINGNGTYTAPDFVTQDTYISINGSGTANVNAEDYISVKIFGSGSLKYKGQPEVEQVISGSGSIESTSPKQRKEVKETPKEVQEAPKEVQETPVEEKVPA